MLVAVLVALSRVNVVARMLSRVASSRIIVRYRWVSMQQIYSLHTI